MNGTQGRGKKLRISHREEIVLLHSNEKMRKREKRQRRKKDRRKKTKTSHLEAEEEDEGFSLHERTSFSQFKHGKKIRGKI